MQWSITVRKMCWRRPRRSTRQSRAIKYRSARRRARYCQGQYRSERLCHHQRSQAAARRYCHRQQPRDRQSAQAVAIILGRTNCPAFSYRWFTTNLIHGDTKNPRDPGITPGGSSGGAAAAVAAGIGHIAHGTDIAGSIRYPAYACGIHGLRPTVGRIAAFNASLPNARSDLRSAQFPVHSRAPSAISGSRWQRCPAETHAIPGGYPRRWKDPRCRSGRHSASSRTALRPPPK